MSRHTLNLSCGSETAPTRVASTASSDAEISRISIRHRLFGITARLCGSLVQEITRFVRVRHRAQGEDVFARPNRAARRKQVRELRRSAAGGSPVLLPAWRRVARRLGAPTAAAAVMMAAVGATGASAQSPLNFASICSGVRVTLPALAPVSAGLVTTLDGLTPLVTPGLGTLLGGNFNILSGANAGVGVLDGLGNVIAPAACAGASAPSFAVTTNRGISLGGGQITGLGGTLGFLAAAADPTAIAIGNGASTAVGATNAVAVGGAAQASTTGAVAIGNNALAQGGQAVSVGVGNTATGIGAVALGNANTAFGNGTVALGNGSNAAVAGSIALGNGAGSTVAEGIAIGSGTRTTGAYGIAQGFGATAGIQGTTSSVVPGTVFNGAIAIGSGANAAANTGGTSLAIGNRAAAAPTSNAGDSVAIGTDTTASGTDSLALGAQTTATAANTIAIGNNGTANAGANAIVVGVTASATALAANSVVLGSTSTATAANTTVLGSLASSSAAGGVALGSGSIQARTGLAGGAEAFSQTTVASQNGSVSVGSAGLERQITSVAGGTLGTDAVNLRQLRSVAGNVATTLGSTFDATTGAYTAPTYTVGGTTYGTVAAAITALDAGTGGGAFASDNIVPKPAPVATGLGATAGGFGASATGAGSTVVGNGATDNGKAASTVVGSAAATVGASAVAVGAGAVANANRSIAIGPGANTVAAPSVGGVASVAIGDTATASGDGAVALGLNGIATGTGAIAAGNKSTATGDSALSLGDLARAAGTSATAIGVQSKATGEGAFAAGTTAIATGAGTLALGNAALAGTVGAAAIGPNAAATGAQSIAFGSGSSAIVAGGVALGSGSVAARAGLSGAAENFSGTTVASTNGVLSVGIVGGERQIANVAGGTLATDAVNVRQLQAVGANLTGSLGAGAAFNPLTGAYVPPAFVTALGTTAATVQGALTNETAAITALGTGTAAKLGGGTTYNLVTGGLGGGFTVNGTTYTDVAGAISGVAAAGSVIQRTGILNQVAVTALAGTGASPGLPQTITNVAQGAVTALSTDAVNGSQLFATNQAVANLATGTTGLVRQDPATRVIAVGAGTDGTSVAFANGTGTSRSLTGVAAGQIAAASTQAVNGSQLYATAQSVSTALGGGSTVKLDGTLAVPTYIVAGAAYNDVGSAVTALDTGIASGKLGAFVANNIAGKAGPAAGGANATAGGFGASAAGPGTTAIGSSAVDNGVANSTVLGSGASITAGLTGSNVALGQSSVATVGARANYAAFGLTPLQNAVGTVSVGSVGAERTISNVAAGAAGTDAVNVAQLSGATANLGGSVATGLGGGATYNAATGQITGPTYTVGGKAYTDVGSAITAGNALGVQYTADANGNPTGAVDLTKGGTLAPARLGGLAPGALSATSTDAVNGSQLYATNQTVANLAAGRGGAFAADNTSGQAVPAATGANSAAGGFGALASGGRSTALGAGAAAGGTNSVALGAGSTDGGIANVVSVGAAGAERRITNVAAGVNPTDAANTGQLTALAARSLQYDTTATGQTNLQSVTLNPTGSGPVTIHNVAAGIALTDAVNVSQLGAVSANAVQYGTNADGTRSNTLALMGGTAGAPVTVSNVAAGVAATDAVNVGQLQGALNSQYNNLAQIGDYQFRSAKQTAYAGTSIALATAGIRYDDRPGKISLGLGASGYHGSAGLAVGLGGTSEDGKWRVNVSAGFSPNNQKGAAGIMGGASYTFN